MEKIDGIRILHVDGLGGGSGGGGHRSSTDEVLESALRYRPQAPLIDAMMQAVGVAGSCVARLRDLLPSARPAQRHAQEADAKKSKQDDCRQAEAYQLSAAVATAHPGC